MSDTNPKPDRRSERSKQAILDATRELLAEEDGVRALTIEAAAARSGVAKTTIYRRWHDKWELALLGRNLTNKYVYVIGNDKVFSTPGQITVYSIRPREIVLQGTIHY